MILVVDASVACKWFVRETLSVEAGSLPAESYVLIAPDLIIPEVCNVACLKLRRREIDRERAGSMVRDLPDFLDELVESVELAERAFNIAAALAHPVYDCFYLALAEARQAKMVTADLRLLSRIEGTPWTEHATSLAACPMTG